MLICPHCRTKLAAGRTGRGIWWSCGACGGVAATLPILRKEITASALGRIWADAGDARAEGARRCPSCRRPMRTVEPLDEVSLDVCRTCQLVWFDRGELEEFPAAPSQPDELSTERAKDAFAALLLQAHAPSQSPEQPEGRWKALVALVGLPVEFDATRLSRRPWVTWSLVFAIASISLLASTDFEKFREALGFSPGDAFRFGGLTWFSAFFLQGSLLQLAANVYFLAVLGDDVEDHLGPARYLVLVAAASLLGMAFHALLTAAPDELVLGASGAVSGVILYYALQFPRIRVGIPLIPPYWWRVSALGALALWIALQIVGLALSAGAGPYLTHVGGAAAGLLYWVIKNRRASA